MNTFSVSEALTQGWILAKKHGLYIAIILLVIAIIFNFLSALTLPANFMQRYVEMLQASQTNPLQAKQMMQNIDADMGVANIAMSWFISILDLLVEAALMVIVLRLTKGVLNKVSIKGCKLPIIAYVKYFAIIIIVGLLVLVGTIFCIIPGIFVAVRLMFAGTYVLDHPEAGIGDSISASWNMTSRNFWNLVGLSLCELGICIIGLCCCCIGILFAYPVCLFVNASAYYMLLEKIEPAQPDTASFE